MFRCMKTCGAHEHPGWTVIRTGSKTRKEESHGARNKLDILRSSWLTAELRNITAGDIVYEADGTQIKTKAGGGSVIANTSNISDGAICNRC